MLYQKNTLVIQLDVILVNGFKLESFYLGHVYEKLKQT